MENNTAYDYTFIRAMKGNKDDKKLLECLETISKALNDLEDCKAQLCARCGKYETEKTVKEYCENCRWK